MKRAFHILLLLLALFSWKSFFDQGKEIRALEQQYEEVFNIGDPDGVAHVLDEKIEGAQGLRIFTGLLLTFLTAGVFGILVVVYLLPLFAQKVTHAVYDSGEILEKDNMREAHSLLAQGEYLAAIDAFKKVADEDPYNRLPWVEIAKIHRVRLHDPATALTTLHTALESHDWIVDDAAYLMFRIAELYDEDFNDRITARTIMHQVAEEFPETRHSANAIHKLRDWDHQDEEAARHSEEQSFLASQQADEVGEADDAGDEPSQPGV